MRLRTLIIVACLASCVWLLGCAGRKDPRAESWPQADQLFRRDPHWVGGDGAYSVDLGGGRVLWLFGESIIDASGEHDRGGVYATMVSNSLGVQHGYNPAGAGIKFEWKTDRNGRSIPYFPDGDTFRRWPGHGVRLGDRLLLFLMRVKAVREGVGFEAYDWDAVLVRNPGAAPSRWEMSWLDAPRNEFQIVFGSGAVVREDGFVYAYGSREPGGREVYLARWPEKGIYAGNTRGMQWWAGGWGWVPHGSVHRPVPVFRDGAREFTVHRDPATGHYLQVQTQGSGPAVVTVRQSSRLTGPWSTPRVVYRPPETEKPGIVVYQGKAHPYLQGADLVLTYSTNGAQLRDVVGDETIYYPRFVRVKRE